MRELTRSYKRFRTGLLVSGLVGVSLLAGCQATTTADQSAYKRLTADALYAKAVQVARCAEEAGQPGLEPQPDGSVNTGAVPVAQQAALSKVVRSCQRQIFGDTAANAKSLSDEQIRHLYRLQLAARECLLKNGTKTSDPPSQEVFVDSYNTEKQWDAWAAATPPLSPTQAQALTQTCPDPTWFIGLDKNLK